jgi:hypothetical protein
MASDFAKTTTVDLYLLAFEGLQDRDGHRAHLLLFHLALGRSLLQLPVGFHL